MKSLKKGMAFVLLFGALLSATACSGSSDDNSITSSDNTSSTVSTVSSDESEKTSDESSTKTSTEESTPQESLITNGETVDASWFDDAVFVGDSVTLKLNYYCDDNIDALGNAQFFCAGSLGYTNALWDLDREDAVHPTYKGTTYLSADCASVTGASKVFVMLGMNDIGLYGVDGALESAETLLDNITTNSPDAVIYVQSVTPIMEDAQGSKWNNDIVRTFNEKLKDLCKEKGYGFLDVYSVMADENGNLRPEYCSDPVSTGGMGIHFTDEACKIWADYLKANVSSAMNY